MITVFFTLSLAFQNQVVIQSSDPLDTADTMRQSEARERALEQASDRQFDLFLERKFEIRYNDVAKALGDFGASWNRRHAIDPAKARRLKKAWHELGKAEPWFDTSAGK